MIQIEYMIITFKQRWRLGNLLRLLRMTAQAQVVGTIKLELTTTAILTTTARALIQQMVSFERWMPGSRKLDLF